MSVPQPVTVTGAADEDKHNARVQVSHRVSGYSVTGHAAVTAAAAVTVTVADADAGLAIVPATLNMDEGGSGNYTVALKGRPLGTVTVRLSSADPGAG